MHELSGRLPWTAYSWEGPSLGCEHACAAVCAQCPPCAAYWRSSSATNQITHGCPALPRNIHTCLLYSTLAVQGRSIVSLGAQALATLANCRHNSAQAWASCSLSPVMWPISSDNHYLLAPACVHCRIYGIPEVEHAVIVNRSS